MPAHPDLRFFLLGRLLALELAGNLEPVLHNRAALDDVGTKLAPQRVHLLVQLSGNIGKSLSISLLRKRQVFSCIRAGKAEGDRDIQRKGWI